MKPTFLDFPLYAVPDPSQTPAAPRGAGKRDIWALFDPAPEDPAEIENFLAKVFGAAKVDFEQDTKYISLTSSVPISFSQFPDAVGAKYVFLFGIEGQRVGLHFQLPPYQPVRFGSAVYLMADPIAAIYRERQEGGKAMSGKLWKALQHCFGL